MSVDKQQSVLTAMAGESGTRSGEGRDERRGVTREDRKGEQVTGTSCGCPSLLTEAEAGEESDICGLLMQSSGDTTS